MTAPEPAPQRQLTPELSPAFRELAWRHDVRKAQNAIAGALGIALFIAVLYWLAEATPGSLLFYVLVLSVVGVAVYVHQWWKLRRRGPLSEADAIREHAAREANASVVERHKAVLATRPTRLTWGLLGCIGAATACQLFAAGGAGIERAALVKPLARQGEWWRLVSATYLHGGFMHFWFNATAIHALGPLVEAYAPRSRLPLVWLVSALGGSVASLLLMPNTTSVGASGGVLGLAGYLWVMARRRPHELPPWLGRGIALTLALNAVLGIVGYAFIDNAAHAGGAAAGALFGFVTIPRATDPATAAAPAHREESHRLLDPLGVLAAFAIWAGAFLTIGKLLQL